MCCDIDCSKLLSSRENAHIMLEMAGKCSNYARNWGLCFSFWIMLFEADYAKNYASILYQCLPAELSSERGEKEVLADSNQPTAPPSTKSHVRYCAARARRREKMAAEGTSSTTGWSLLQSVLVSAVDSCHCRRASGSVFWFYYYSPVVELLVLLLCILTCKQIFSSSSIQGHLPWLRCSFDLVVHRPHRHHPFSLALRRPLRLATSQPRSGLSVWCFSCSHNKTSSRRREKRPQEVVDCAVVIRDCMLLPSFVTTAVRHPGHVFVADDNRAVGVPIADSHPGSASPPASSVRRRSLCPISFKIHRKMSPCVGFVIVTSFLVMVYCPLSIAYSPLVVTSNAVACLWEAGLENPLPIQWWAKALQHHPKLQDFEMYVYKCLEKYCSAAKPFRSNYRSLDPIYGFYFDCADFLNQKRNEKRWDVRKKK